MVYFERMEITDPDVLGDGLVCREWPAGGSESTTGRLQLGDDTFIQRAPAAINVAGDPDDRDGPTYATFGAALASVVPAADGALLTTAPGPRRHHATIPAWRTMVSPPRTA